MAAVAHQGAPAPVTHTFSAMRSPNFRIYFTGQLISLSGTWMQTVAQGWLIFHLTKSEFMLGLVACLAGLPALLLSPFAGVVLDRFSKRNVLIVANLFMMAQAFILAWLTFTDQIQIWHIFVIAFMTGIANAVDAPSRQSFVAELVDTASLSSGIALNSVMYNSSRVFGPSLAGVFLTQAGPAWCFLVNGFSFVAVLLTLRALRLPRRAASNTAFAPIASLREGLRFARTHPTIAPLLMLAVVSSLLTVNISQILPAFADVNLNSPRVGYSALSTATGFGAALAALVTVKIGRRFRRGRVVAVMIAVSALSVILASQMTTVEGATVFMALYGFGIILLFVTANTLIQSEVPDEFRGRVMSLYTLTFFGVSPFGALGLGFLAQYIGTPIAMTLYALTGGSISLWIILRSRPVMQLV